MRFRGEAKRPLKMIEFCGHCAAAAVSKARRGFPFVDGENPNGWPYAAALTAVFRRAEFRRFRAAGGENSNNRCAYSYFV